MWQTLGPYVNGSWRRCGRSPPRMRIDLSEVSFIDSSAVGLLVAMKRRVNDYGGHFSVRCGEQALLALRMRGLVGYLNAKLAWLGARVDGRAPVSQK